MERERERESGYHLEKIKPVPSTQLILVGLCFYSLLYLYTVVL